MNATLVRAVPAYANTLLMETMCVYWGHQRRLDRHLSR